MMRSVVVGVLAIMCCSTAIAQDSQPTTTLLIIADPEDATTGGQYEGWPIVIDQVDNFNPPSWSKLPEIRVEDVDNAVFQVIAEATDEIVYTIRISGRAWTPHVPRTGTYSVRVGEPERNKWVTIRHLNPTDKEGEWISVSVH